MVNNVSLTIFSRWLFRSKPRKSTGMCAPEAWTNCRTGREDLTGIRRPNKDKYSKRWNIHWFNDHCYLIRIYNNIYIYIYIFEVKSVWVAICLWNRFQGSTGWESFAGGGPLIFWTFKLAVKKHQIDIDMIIIDYLGKSTRNHP